MEDYVVVRARWRAERYRILAENTPYYEKGGFVAKDFSLFNNKKLKKYLHRLK